MCRLGKVFTAPGPKVLSFSIADGLSVTQHSSGRGEGSPSHRKATLLHPLHLSSFFPIVHVTECDLNEAPHRQPPGRISQARYTRIPTALLQSAHSITRGEVGPLDVHSWFRALLG